MSMAYFDGDEFGWNDDEIAATSSPSGELDYDDIYDLYDNEPAIDAKPLTEEDRAFVNETLKKIYAPIIEQQLNDRTLLHGLIWHNAPQWFTWKNGTWGDKGYHGNYYTDYKPGAPKEGTWATLTRSETPFWRSKI